MCQYYVRLVYILYMYVCIILGNKRDKEERESERASEREREREREKESEREGWRE